MLTQIMTSLRLLALSAFDCWFAFAAGVCGGVCVEIVCLPAATFVANVGAEQAGGVLPCRRVHRCYRKFCYACFRA